MSYLLKIKELSPIIHCITSHVVSNDMANALLFVGAKPVMAEHWREVDSITSNSNVLLLNMGCITDEKIKSMKISATTAKEKNIPYVLDCVGVGSSKVRLEAVKEIININMPSVIKGNAAEIMALCTDKMSNSGVDSKSVADIGAIRRFVEENNTVIMVTGDEDIIADKEKTVRVKNGCEEMAKVTGTGCVLGAMVSAHLAVCDAFTAAVYAAAFMGICGETAEKKNGLYSFKTSLYDNISIISDIEENIRKEEEKWI